MTHWRQRTEQRLRRDPIFAAYWIGFLVGAAITFGVLHP